MIPCDHHVVYKPMALTKAKEDDFSILPPLGVPSSSTDQQSANGSGVQLFHEIGGTVFEIPPLPDDFDEFPLSPDAIKTSSNEGIFSLPMGVDTLANSPLPPPLSDSSLPPPLPDLSIEEPEFAPFTAAAPLSSVNPLPNGASSSTTPSQSTVVLSTPSSGNEAATDDSKLAASSEGWTDDGFDGFADFTSFQSNAIKEPATTTAATTGSSMVSFPVVSTSASDISTSIASVANPSNTATTTTSNSDIGYADFTSWSTASESHKPAPAPSPSSSQNQASDFGKFDSFSNPTTTAEEGVGNFAAFGDFNAFSDPVSNTVTLEVTATKLTPEREGFSGIRESDSVIAEKEVFSDFNAFSDPVSNTVASEPVTKKEIIKPTAAESSSAAIGEEFGAFSSGDNFNAFSGPTTTAEEGFSAFSDFNAFSDPVSTTATTASEVIKEDAIPMSAATEGEEFGAFSGGGDFGAFSDAGTSVMEKNDKGFGDFQGDDDFGEFGGFSAPPPPVSSTETSTASLSTAKSMGMSISSQRPDSQTPKDVMFMCFPLVAVDAVVGVAGSSVLHITQYLQSSNNWVWSSLSNNSASTNSLYQWKQSLLQDHFYTSLNVDPILAPAVKTATAQTPVYSKQLSDGLLSPGTGLLEGFGFESIAKPEPQTKMEAAGDTAFGWEGSQGATLLDLSLPPSSPTHPSEQGVSLDADLVGLDFTSAPSHTEPLPTTTDYSTWMDAELLELEAANTCKPESSRVQLTAGPVASMQEHLVQLGLDTSKTTWRQKTPDTHQLSEEARTLLEKLPDLSFMICEPPSEIL